MLAAVLALMFEVMFPDIANQRPRFWIRTDHERKAKVPRRSLRSVAIGDHREAKNRLSRKAGAVGMVPPAETEGILHMPHYTALVTVLAVLFYFYTGARVPGARRQFGVPAPAISGNPDFERVFRVQMNTLECMPIFL